MARLHELIGIPGLNHSAYKVEPGKMAEAINFFTQELGWEEDLSALVGNDEDGWVARFVHPPKKPSVRIQLTDTWKNVSKCGVVPGFHVGVDVPSAKQAAQTIKTWAITAGYESQIEPANSVGNKWFVSIKGLFTFDLELITL